MTAQDTLITPAPSAAVSEFPGADFWSLSRKLAHLPYLLILDSAGGPAHLRRYSYVTADPFRWLQARGRRVVIANRLPNSAGRIVERGADPFAVLARELAKLKNACIPGLPHFQGGAAGLFGYDLCHHLEKLPRPQTDEFSVPDMAVGFYDWVIAHDHLNDKTWLISTGMPLRNDVEREAHARRRMQFVERLLEAPAMPPFPRLVQTTKAIPNRQFRVPGLANMFSNFDRNQYLATIARAVEYIHAGDCFQVNIAQRLLYPAQESPLALYGRLRQCNPAPFGAFLDLGSFQIASASPERFVRVRDGNVVTRPIKGTRPRGVTPAEDQRQKTELLHSGKDRAENVMIVDLLRNDLGRVSQYGTVKVDQVCTLETYEYVHHLVSEVHGKLRAGLGPIDLLRASFPGGSVTGAPKIRAMEIIAELEQTARGPYCGSLGYIGFDGNMDSNILIRTFTIGKGWVQLLVGGGIVADSLAEMEYDETWHKARGSMQALD